MVYPQHMYEFLALRLLIIPMSVVLHYGLRKTDNIFNIQIMASLYMFGCASAFNTMIFLIDSSSTDYYAGLNMIALGGLAFLPLQRSFFILCVGLIYVPYYAILLFFTTRTKDWSQNIIENTAFLLGSLIICGLIRYSNNKTRVAGFIAELRLRRELQRREKIISIKTEEAVRLSELSLQFSPQVVDAIKDGLLSINSPAQVKNICAVFVDIVNSTEKVINLAPDEIKKVISHFLDTTISIFLKYNLTIDKFQGDGVLAFSNCPIQKADYIEQACQAALEVRQALAADDEFYQIHWKDSLKIRIGISAGPANVGFYGDKKFFRTYSAIGEPLPMAARLTAVARPDQILIDQNISKNLNLEKFSINSAGQFFLKGISKKEIEAFELNGCDAGLNRVNDFLVKAA